MADNNEIRFKIHIITDETSTTDMWNNELQKALNDLLSFADNMVAFIINNSNTKACIAIRFNGGDMIPIFNSEDCFKLSTRNSQVAKNGFTGLFSDSNLALLTNLDRTLNINDTSSTVMQNKTVIDDVLTEADEKENPDTENTKYNLNFDNVLNMKSMKDELDNNTDTLTKLLEYLDFGSNSKSSLEEYINSKIEERIGKIVEGYINHTHN